MNKKHFLFRELQRFIKEEDPTSIEHVLTWVYKKDDLFDLKNDDGLTLIHIACFEGQRGCLEVFLRNGAGVQIRSSVGWTPLHAATLGGKLDVVEYLLNQCSADPLAKDEMGCVASDLTMDKEILETLTRSMIEVTTRRELERLAVTLPTQHSKRNTYCFDLVEHDSPSQTSSTQLTRAQSMFVNLSEAEYIREQFNKTKTQTIGGLKSSTDEYSSNEWNFTRQNSVPPQKIRKENSPFSNFLRLPATRDSGKGKLRESKNRDSGVFDEDANDDSSSELSMKSTTQNIVEEHYSLI